MSEQETNALVLALSAWRNVMRTRYGNLRARTYDAHMQALRFSGAS